MANKLKGEISVTIEGKVWILVADFNALCDFEETTGELAVEFIDRFETGTVPMRHIRAFVHAMLKARQPDATAIDAGNILSADPDALKRAFDAAFPNESDGDPAAGEARAARG